jgi:hypothetical protein
MVLRALSCRLVNCTLTARRSVTRSVRLRPAPGIGPLSCCFVVERVTRIELALSAWEAERFAP